MQRSPFFYLRTRSMLHGFVRGSSHVVDQWFLSVAQPLVVVAGRAVSADCSAGVGRAVVVVVAGGVGWTLVLFVSSSRHYCDKPEHFPLDTPEIKKHLLCQSPG